MNRPGAGQGVKRLVEETTPEIGALWAMENNALLVALANSGGEVFATPGNITSRGRERLEAFIGATLATLSDRAFQSRLQSNDVSVRDAAVIELAALAPDVGALCAAVLVAKIGCGPCCTGAWASQV